jgi:hypothetical protein
MTDRAAKLLLALPILILLNGSGLIVKHLFTIQALTPIPHLSISNI